jgi:H+/Cl- antiporter ClcA
MDAEVVFAAIYATVVVLAAVALDRVGRATSRQPGARTTGPDHDGPAWPHIASVTLHTAIAAMASAAGLLVAAVVAVRHHHPPEIGVLAVPAVLAALTLHRCYRRLRETAAAAGLRV